MWIKSAKSIRALDDHWSHFSFHQNFQKLKNQNQNDFDFFFDQFVNQNWQNSDVNNLVDAVCKFGNSDHGFVGIGSDLYDIVIKKIFDERNNL